MSPPFTWQAIFSAEGQRFVTLSESDRGSAVTGPAVRFSHSKLTRSATEFRSGQVPRLAPWGMRLISRCCCDAADRNGLDLALGKNLLPVDDQLRPEPRGADGNPDDGVEAILVRGIEEADGDTGGEEDESPGIGAHHPFAMPGDIAAAHEFDGD